MVAKNEITTDWLSNILTREGYTVNAGPQADSIVARHQSRANLIVRINRDFNIITFTHSWKLKKPDFMHSEKDLLIAINTADAMSWYETFFRDQDGDLGVSSAIFITEQVSEADVSDFLRREWDKFSAIVIVSKLKDWMQ